MGRPPFRPPFRPPQGDPELNAQARRTLPVAERGRARQPHSWPAGASRLCPPEPWEHACLGPGSHLQRGVASGRSPSTVPAVEQGPQVTPVPFTSTTHCGQRRRQGPCVAGAASGLERCFSESQGSALRVKARFCEHLRVSSKGNSG